MKQTKMSFHNDLNKKWYIVDANDLILGRMSSEISKILTGKNKITYTPHEDHGDFVIVINSDKVKLTGDKLKNKMYYAHSGFPSGLRTRTGKTMIDKYSDEMIYKSIWGMIPHTKLGRKQVKKLFIYKNENHKHEAQKPKLIKLKI